VKRLLDIIISAVALILLCPVILWTSWKVRKHLGVPIVFRQSRPGLNAKPFELVKFRSMRDAIDSMGNPLHDSLRAFSAS